MASRWMACRFWHHGGLLRTCHGLHSVTVHIRLASAPLQVNLREFQIQSSEQASSSDSDQSGTGLEVTGI